MKNYKNIGFVIALEDESLNVLNNIGIFIKEYNFGKINIKKFKKNNINLFFAYSGIGEINSAMTTTILINNFNIDLIFNFGLVGSLNKDLKQGDCVFVNEIIHYDFTLDSKNKELEGIYQNKNSKIFIVPKVNILNNMKLNYVRIASGDKFISEEKLKNNIINKHDCKICDMESAGINLVCENFNIDRIFLKCVSDNADNNADNDFKNVIKNGVNEYVKVIYDLLNKI